MFVTETVRSGFRHVDTVPCREGRYVRTEYSDRSHTVVDVGIEKCGRTRSRTFLKRPIRVTQLYGILDFSPLYTNFFFVSNHVRPLYTLRIQ